MKSGSDHRGDAERTGPVVMLGVDLLAGATIGDRYQLAEKIGVAQSGTANRVEETLRLAGLPTELPPGCGANAILEAMRSDKKVRTGSIRLSLPLRIGAMAGAESGWTVSVSDDQLREVLA